MGVLSELKPKEVFESFEYLSSVPHGSRNNAQISELLCAFAREHGLRYIQDKALNVIIFKDGSEGYENSAPVILQGHMDMVCVKAADCPKDLKTEPVDIVTDGEWIWADGTSLGADNCIGCAMALALLASDLPHPPLECVFTTDEEIGMDGAKAIDLSCLKGRKYINLDCGPEGVYIISCAGGETVDGRVPARMTRMKEGEAACHLQIAGLIGGHSGGMIHLGRGNANQLMGRLLCAIKQRIPEMRLFDVAGGVVINAITDKCDAVVVIPESRVRTLSNVVKETDEIYKNVFQTSDPGVYARYEKLKETEGMRGMSAKDTEKVIRMLLAIPQGVQRMSADIEGLTETSLNMGILEMEDQGLRFSISIRSSVNSEKKFVEQIIRSAVLNAGGSVEISGEFAAWPYVKESPLRDLVAEVYKEQTGKDAVIKATHGGLESGIFIDKIPGTDAVAMGPIASGAHSPEERVNVASVGRTYALLCEVLKRLK